MFPIDSERDTKKLNFDLYSVLGNWLSWPAQATCRIENKYSSYHNFELVGRVFICARGEVELFRTSPKRCTDSRKFRGNCLINNICPMYAGNYAIRDLPV